MIMRKIKSASLAMVLAGTFVMAQPSRAQSATPLYDPPPAYPGFQVPRIAGTLNYSVSLSENVQRGDYGTGAYYGTSISGNMGYISSSPRHQFSMIYSGGYSKATDSLQSGFFQDLAASQVLSVGRYSILLSDIVSYLPRSPVQGLSGVAGIGDLGSNPGVPITENGDGLQSDEGARLSNVVSASVSRPLTGHTSINATGSYDILRFPGDHNDGIGSDATSLSGGLSHAISARTQLSGSYFFSRFSYLGYNVTYSSQGADVSLSHQWSAKLSTSVSGGPEYTTSNGVPGSLNFNAGAQASYKLGQNFLSANYSRSVQNGSGVTLAVRSDLISGSLSHKLGRYSNISTSLSYNRSTTLPSLIAPTSTYSSFVGGAQVSRSLSRSLSAYLSISGGRQNTSASAFQVNALQGYNQTLGFGLTYSPRSITIGRQ